MASRSWHVNNSKMGLFNYDNSPAATTMQCMCPECGGLQYTEGGISGMTKAAAKAWGSAKNKINPGKTVLKQEQYSEERVRSVVTTALQQVFDAHSRGEAIKAANVAKDYMDKYIEYHMNRGSGNTRGSVPTASYKSSSGGADEYA